MTVAVPDPTIEPAGADAQEPQAQRFERLSAGIAQIRTQAKRMKFTERTLMIIGGILAPIGILLVFVGWYGAAHSPYLFQQIPYLISGGLLGLALVFAGGFFYFAHWMTEAVREQRRQASRVIDAIDRLETTLRSMATPAHDRTNGAARGVGAVAGRDLVVGEEAPVAAPAVPGGDRSEGEPVAGESARAAAAPRVLVATNRGTVAHRPDCVVVAGKTGIRRITDGEQLGACRLCDPFAD
ncbi:MAG TPA: hypothetical protein VHA73_04110 [Acidimicrobiales bacterium]|jgi:hypothetical protein|nr:hypothetical protein [Acidimicrobiales bacterium]